MNLLLSIVIVEYHSINDIMRCVASLWTHIKVPFEIIVSSNSCYDKQQRDSIDCSDANVRWLFNERNGGFAYAMNEGMKVAQGDYLAIMNPDCTLDSDLDDMIRFMQRHPDVGAIAPQMHDLEGNIQDTARPYVSLSSFFWRQLRRVLSRKASILDMNMKYNKVQTVDWVIGAFIMVSRKAYEATEGLDDNFFMYAEDLDWCTRIRQKGFEIVYYPNCVITYKGTRRARRIWKYARIFIRSHILYWRKFGFFSGYPRRREQFFDD